MTSPITPTPDRQWAYNEWDIVEYSKGGIRVRALATVHTRDQLKAIPAVLRRVAEGNKWIPDKKFQIRNILINTDADRFAIDSEQVLRGAVDQPFLLLHYEAISPRKAAHEVSHAIFHYYQKVKPKTAERIAEFYIQLADNPKLDGNPRGYPVGIDMVRASRVTKGESEEHPQGDIDEFFASFRASWVCDPEGLTKSIERAIKQAPQIKKIAKELIEFGDRLKEGKAVRIKDGSVSDAARIKLKQLEEKSPVPTYTDPGSGIPNMLLQVDTGYPGVIEIDPKIGRIDVPKPDISDVITPRRTPRILQAFWNRILPWRPPRQHGISQHTNPGNPLETKVPHGHATIFKGSLIKPHHKSPHSTAGARLDAGRKAQEAASAAQRQREGLERDRQRREQEAAIRRNAIHRPVHVHRPSPRPVFVPDRFTHQTFMNRSAANPWVGAFGGTAITRHPGYWRR